MLQIKWESSIGVRRTGVFRTAALAVFVAAVAGLPNLAVAQSLDNKGDDFIFALMPNLTPTGTRELHFTSDVATMVTVEYPVNSPSFTTTVAVNPGAVTIVSLPIATSSAWPINGVANNAVHAFANDDFVCYLVNRRANTSDAALGLPIDTMNTEYIVMDYNPRFVGAEFVVYAAFDNTTVTITPANAIVGHAAGVPFNVSLNKGEGYFARSSVISGAGGTLTGTIISADLPVGLVNGDGCTQVPTGVTACDHIFEVAQPVQTWGMLALVANLPNRPLGSIYRILASVDGTTVTQDGVAIGTINKGQFIETPQITGSHIFAGSNPIFVAQFMRGQTGSGSNVGDPAMGNMIPPEQYLSDYTFSTVGGGQFSQNFVTIIAENADVATILLDGVAVGAGAFTAIGASGFSSAVIPLSQGTHTTSSNGVHGITVEGYNSFDSYIYPGGALFQFINPVGDENSPVCSCNFVQGPPPSGDCTATDNQPSEDVNGNGILDPGEDLNGNGLIDEDTGIFFVALEPGAVNLTLTVAPFVPGDGSVNFTVELTSQGSDGSGTIRVTDGAGNICQIPVLLLGNQPPDCAAGGAYSAECSGTTTSIILNGSGSSDPDGDPLDFSWTTDCPGGTFNDNTLVSPTLTVNTVAPCAPLSCNVFLTVDDGTATDSCQTTLTVDDTVDPMITCPGDMTVECDGSGNTAQLSAWLSSATASDGCDATVDITNNFGSLSDDCGETGQATVMWTATDDCGNTDQCPATFTIEDTIAPAINNLTVNGGTVDANCEFTVTFSATVTDDCCIDEAAVMVNVGLLSGNATMSNLVINKTQVGPNEVDISGSVLVSDLTGCPAEVQVTVDAEDCCNNAAVQAVQTADVEDMTAPVIEDLVVIGGNVDANCQRLVTFSATVRDNCCVLPGGVMVNVTLPSGNATLGVPTINMAQNGQGEVLVTGSVMVSALTGCPAEVLVTVNAEDCCGNAAVPAVASDTVTDRIVPVINNLTVIGGNVGPNCQRLVTFSATVTDNCCVVPAGVVVGVVETTGNATLGVPVINRVQNGQGQVNITGTVMVSNLTACPATVQVTVNANDCCGNAAIQAVAMDNVVDRIVPVINNLAVTGGNVDDNCEFTATFSATVTDNCCVLPGAVMVNVTLPSGNATLSNIVINKVQNGQGQVDVTGSVLVSGLTSCPATVQVTVDAVDCCNNTAMQAVQTADVDDRTPPIITCPPNVTITSGASTAPAATGMATATDNCDPNPTITFSDVVTFPACLADPIHFTITRTWTAVDDCDNSSSCVQTIKVLRKVVTLIIKQGASQHPSGDCPAPVNPNSNGVVPMLLTGDTDFDVDDVFLNTLLVTRCDCAGGDVAPNDGPPGPKILIRDLNHPTDDIVDCNGCACNDDQSSDGMDDIWMKFRTDEMVSALPLIPGGGVVVLAVTGELDAPAYPPGPINVGFVARDCIVIVPPGGQGPINATMESNVLDTFIEVTPLDLNVDSDGFANFGRAYFPETLVTVTAPPSSAGRRFLRWKVDGVPQAIGLRTLEIEITSDVNLEAVYRRSSRLEPKTPTEDEGDME